MMLPLLVSVALAFPLNRPDPELMDGTRCMRHPVDDRNNVELTGHTVGEAPPGAPVLGDLASVFAPFTTDEAKKKAARGKGVTSLPAVTSLVAEGQPVLRAACDRSAALGDDFTEGCKRPKACSVQVTVDGTPLQTGDSGKLGPKLSPIDTPKAAYGLVALVDQDVFLPLTPLELAEWAEEAEGYRAITPAEPWVQVEERTNGWIVRAARKVACGCERDLVRRAYWVDRAGNLCQIEETPVPLAQAVDVEGCD